MKDFERIGIQDGRLPPAYFASSQFGKDAILRDENVFFSKKHSLFIIFHIFFMIQNFLIFFVKKTSKLGQKRQF